MFSDCLVRLPLYHDLALNDLDKVFKYLIGYFDLIINKNIQKH